jgi:hypothetical protein
MPTQVSSPRTLGPTRAMTLQTAATPAALQRAHPEWAPLLTLLALTQESLRDPVWATTRVVGAGFGGRSPWLAGAKVVVDRDRARRKLQQLIGALEHGPANTDLDPFPLLAWRAEGAPSDDRITPAGRDG